jgi:hypothetical protein
MTDKQINAAIAKACGWTEFRDNVTAKAPGEQLNRVFFIPDYCNNLNAMHEAENCLSLNDRNHYIDALGTIYKDSWKFATATARQRAEAFLRTLGKWDQSGEATEMEAQK